MAPEGARLLKRKERNLCGKKGPYLGAKTTRSGDDLRRRIVSVKVHRGVDGGGGWMEEIEMVVGGDDCGEFFGSRAVSFGE